MHNRDEGALVRRIHLGTHLAEELATLDLDPMKLARQLGVLPESIRQILKGRLPVAAEMAISPRAIFQNLATILINLQAICESRTANKEG